ncbi:DUF4430 domain-containing protein [Carnobacterium viridans]|uniref:Transcobalamin-like C-terminal domain-containing protein n=1 Tax=Carnobacterium viridans TaxID=174587 RepID=A0A1H0YRM6_9LACT|nr:DUF4430 domain-containing protein [Carnobacterium viridans]UDE94980.1 DUF4430 domain-containing protein [Carnobacterium viridans]SDQ17882.1 protein of unknown function [Carnobacterium viridans]
MKLIKLALIGVTALSLVACGETARQESDSSAAKSTSLVESQVNETLSIDIVLEEDEKEVDTATKKLEVSEGTTVLEALKKEYEVVEEGGFITSIEGMKQDEKAGKYWMYEVNNTNPTVGAAEYELQDGDQVKWFLNASQ